MLEIVRKQMLSVYEEYYCRVFKENICHIIKYVRNSKRQAVGVLIAYRSNVDGKVYLGVSKCNKKAGDKFDKNTGLSIAVSKSLPLVTFRGDEFKVRQTIIKLVKARYLPDSLRDEVEMMVYRARSYFRVK